MNSIIFFKFSSGFLCNLNPSSTLFTQLFSFHMYFWYNSFKYFFRISTDEIIFILDRNNSTIIGCEFHLTITLPAILIQSRFFFFCASKLECCSPQLSLSCSGFHAISSSTRRAQFNSNRIEENHQRRTIAL